MRSSVNSISALAIIGKRTQHVLSLLAVFHFAVDAQNNDTFTIGSMQVQRGEKVSGSLIVEEGMDEGTFIPITVIHGSEEGPVLTLVAGIHGTEYVPVITLQQLSNEIRPEDLSGTIIFVLVANVPSFRARAVYSSPVDNKNLNRVFPGDKDGTLTERIAFALANEIAGKSDYYIDLHGGEFNERVVDFLYFSYNCPDPALCEKTRILAHATGNKYLIPDDFGSIPDTAPSVNSDVEALRQGAAGITLEWGDRGMALPEEIDFARKGMRNVMRTLGMLPGEPFVNEHAVYMYDPRSVYSNFDGILYTLVDRGQYVTAGTLIGYATDYWGKVLEEYRSPITGIILSVKVAPAINKAEKVFSVAEASDELRH